MYCINSLFIITLFFLTASSLKSQPADKVNGNLIQFNDNGAWCWYQDERAIIDGTGKLLIVGSIANAAGVGGSSRSADVEVVTFDLETRVNSRLLQRIPRAII